MLREHSDCKERYSYIRSLNIRSLIDAHDTIAQKNYDFSEELLIENNTKSAAAVVDDNDDLPYYARPPIDAIRMIGIRKINDEPLGITVRVNDNGDLEFARIMHGGMIDKQGMLHEGDIIKEVMGN